MIMLLHSTIKRTIWQSLIFVSNFTEAQLLFLAASCQGRLYKVHISGTRPSEI